MSDIYLYIDESGNFYEALLSGKDQPRPSIVAGVCSEFDAGGWDRELFNLTQSFNAENGTTFKYPAHFHCAPLYKGEDVSLQDRPFRKRFAGEIKSLIARRSLFIFASQNPPHRFEFCKQATYGVNLIAAIRAAATHLSESGIGATSVTIVVAQRSIAETDNGDPRYTAGMLRFIQSQVCAGSGPGPEFLRHLKKQGNLHLTHDIATVNGGLIAADFACGMVRDLGPGENHSRIVLTEPDDVIFGTYHERYEAELKALLDNHQYAAALTFQRINMPQGITARAIAPIMTALKKEADSSVLARELQALLLEARYLIERRLQILDGLTMARDILAAVISAAQKKITAEGQAGQKRVWIDSLVQALADQVVCFNHIGDTSRQSDVEACLKQVMQDYRSILPISRAERSELLLEVKVRNLNILFNDYRFQDVVDAIQPDADARADSLEEGETDELLGKMYGSLGQAFAFMARTEPEWSEEARLYFEKSIKHFQPGTLFHSMSVNYLCTLAWQEENLELAIMETQRSPSWPQINGPLTLFAHFDSLISHPDLGPFDLVNLLRLCALATEQGIGRLSREQIEHCQKMWSSKLTDEHPTEQIYKWLAYLHMCNDNNVAAIQLCDRGLEVCKKLGFTVKTIGLSILGMKIMAQGHQCRKLDAEWIALKDELCMVSEAFSEYFHNSQIASKYSKGVTAFPLEPQSNYMPPFTYA
jgi:hypothetical protein